MPEFLYGIAFRGIVFPLVLDANARPLRFSRDWPQQRGPFRRNWRGETRPQTHKSAKRRVRFNARFTLNCRAIGFTELALAALRFGVRPAFRNGPFLPFCDGPIPGDTDFSPVTRP